MIEVPIHRIGKNSFMYLPVVNFMNVVIEIYICCLLSTAIT